MSILEGSVTGSVAGSLQLNGEGGTDNYNELINKPQINGVTLSGNKDSADLNIISDVQVNDVTCVDSDHIARITIPPAPSVPVQNVLVNGQSAMVGTTAEITIPPAPTVPVQDVEVNGSSVVIGGVAEITIPPAPTIPVTDVEVNNASVVSGTVAEISVPVLDVKVDGASVVDGNGDANITLPLVPVQNVEVDGASVVDADGIAQITMPIIPTIPVTDVEVNGSSVMSGTVANIVLVASDVSYDNSNSGYTASQTQAAIDEAASNISANASDISDLNTNVGDFSTPLDTTAQNCHDAINELKGTLVNKNSTLIDSTSNCYGIVNNNVTTVTFGGGTINITNNAWTTIGSLPTGFPNPKTDIYAAINFGSTLNKTGVVKISSAGVISYYCYTSGTATQGIWGEVVY